MESLRAKLSAPAQGRAVAGDDLHVGAIGDGLARVTQLLELVLLDLGEAPLGGNGHLLTSGELELGAAQRLDGGVLEAVQGADGPGGG